MNYRTIELQLRQLEESFSKSRSNIYSDRKKETHFQDIYKLFLKIRDSDYKNFNSRDITYHVFFLDVIFSNLEYLDNSTLNIIPYEIVSCLEFALNDWVSSDEFIIVTSMSNKMNDFYLKTTLDEEQYKIFITGIHHYYNLKIEHRLIQISLPKILSRDYLSCVVLYHELGHFIDKELNISSKLVFGKFNKTPKDLDTAEKKFYHHKMEYFADLFAAQYVADASSKYLFQISRNNLESDTHPSTSSRIDVTNEFLEEEINDIVNDFNKVLASYNLPILKKRYEIIEPEESNFQQLYPQQFRTVEELHYIFKLGWDIWNNSDNNFLKNFTSRDKYNIINNLIEKSISNYVVRKNWEETKLSYGVDS